MFGECPGKTEKEPWKDEVNLLQVLYRLTTSSKSFPTFGLIFNERSSRLDNRMCLAYKSAFLWKHDLYLLCSYRALLEKSNECKLVNSGGIVQEKKDFVKINLTGKKCPLDGKLWDEEDLSVERPFLLIKFKRWQWKIYIIISQAKVFSLRNKMLLTWNWLGKKLNIMSSRLIRCWLLN